MAFVNDSVVLNNATNVRNNGVVSARHKLEQIEAYIIVTTIFMVFLVVFGSCRRRSHSVFLKILIWIAYALPTYLITYTFGLMQSASFENELFAIWAIFLIIFSGNADCISAYSLVDNENRRRYNMEVLVKYYGLGWLTGTYGHEIKFRILLYFLFAFALLRTTLRGAALSLASRTDGLVKNTKLIADFMANEHTLSNEGEVDPSCMKGYKYWVKGEEKEKVEVIPPLYQYHLMTANEVVTIDMIWQCQGSLLSSTGDSDGRLKDICLSCALFRLLCRRFAGYSMSESSQLKTWNFVRHGLLAKEGDHERAFRVIELFIVIIGCLIVTPILKHYHTPIGDLNLLTVSGRDVDVRVTAIVIVAILFMEVVQFLVVNFSDWAKVVQEARDKLKGCNSPATMYDKMRRLGEDDHPGETIIERGAVLGKHLLVDITDNERRWKILADFWADMMLFVSPSDDTTVHAEHLTKGGEFVTHLWALLSHAGILNRDSAQNV
nr:hypothetical protein CFP56_27676 [Quercus suber]